MNLGMLNSSSQYAGAVLDYQDGSFTLGNGQTLTLQDVLRVDSGGGIDWNSDETREWLYANQERLSFQSQQPVAMESEVAGMDGTRRTQLLAQAIQANVVRGARVESQGPVSAVMIWGKSVNHVLHLLLTLLTGGLWAIVWIVLTISGGESRTTITVDEFGNVLSQRT